MYDNLYKGSASSFLGRVREVTLNGDDLNQLAADSDGLTSTMMLNPPPRPVNALRRVSRQEHEKLVETILKAAVELRDTCDDRFLCDEEASKLKDAQIDFIIQDHLRKVYERRDDLLNLRRQDKLELVRHLRCLLSVVNDITPDPALQ